MRTVHLVVTAVLSIGSVARAQTVLVPPVDISVLTHEHTNSMGSPPLADTVDSVRFPCTAGACNGPGFTASIGTGTTVVIRFEAPAGTQFSVRRAHFGSQTFFAYAQWQTGTADSGSNFVATTVNFENFGGTPPTLALSDNYVSDNGHVLHTYNAYGVNANFWFTALEVRFTVNNAMVPASRTYSPVDSTMTRSFGSWHQLFGSNNDSIVMTIEPIPGTGFCFGDGSGSDCPCANSGSPGRGCQNSLATGGAQLSATGTSNPDTMVLNVTGENPTALTIFLQGNQAIAAVPYGDGLRCVHGVLKRLYTKTASGGVTSAPQGGDLSITARSAQLNHPIAHGSTRYYMTFYRDGDPGFCPSPTGSTFNGSNGWTILW